MWHGLLSSSRNPWWVLRETYDINLLTTKYIALHRRSLSWEGHSITHIPDPADLHKNVLVAVADINTFVKGVVTGLIVYVCMSVRLCLIYQGPVKRRCPIVNFMSVWLTRKSFINSRRISSIPICLTLTSDFIWTFDTLFGVKLSSRWLIPLVQFSKKIWSSTLYFLYK